MSVPPPREPAGSRSIGGLGPQRPRKHGWVRDMLPAILGLLLLVALGVGALLLGSDEEPKRSTAKAETTAAAPAATTETATTETTPPEQAAAPPADAPEAAPKRDAEPKPDAEPRQRGKRTVRVRFRRLRGGLRGRATVTVRRTRPGHGTMTITARVPRSTFDVRLVKRRGAAKPLLSARGGPATVTRRIPLSTFRRYRSIDVLARRLPARRGRGRVSSLRVRTARIARRFDRRR